MTYNGLELYRGPSQIDGEDVVVLLSLHSGNRKTGDMCQVWTMRADVPPMEAIKKGLDASVCGQCQHRHYLGGGCYVDPIKMGPTAVWRSWAAGHYPKATRRHISRLRGRAIRFGSYGDPAAAPLWVWQPLLKVAGFTTGYTHQRDADRAYFEFLMVSADSEGQALFYQSFGMRTFRVKRDDEPLLEGEVMCPSGGKQGIQCLDCGLCSGATQDGPNIAINVHGSRAKRFERIAVREVA